MCWALAIPAIAAVAGQAISLNQQEKVQNAQLNRDRTALETSQKQIADANKALANTAEAKGRTGQDIATAAGTDQGFQNQGSTLLTGYGGVDPNQLSLSGQRLYGGRNTSTTNLHAGA